MASAEEIRLIHESKIIYCCKNSLDSALTSGLIGGMQKYGYTEANKQASLAAFVKVGNILADGYGVSPPASALQWWTRPLIAIEPEPFPGNRWQ